MQESIQSAFNPVKLVESLKLRTTEQQDAQELVYCRDMKIPQMTRVVCLGSRSYLWPI